MATATTRSEDKRNAGVTWPKNAAVTEAATVRMSHPPGHRHHAALSGFTFIASLLSNTKVSDRSQPPLTDDLPDAEPAGSGSLGRLGGHSCIPDANHPRRGSLLRHRRV